MSNAIILFDGVCHLCRGSVRFIIKRDPNDYFKFASLQSDVGLRIMKQYDIPQPSILNTMILINDEQVYYRSTATLRIAKQLSGAWPAMMSFIVIPTIIRDGVYNFIGNRRYDWFGKSDACWQPNDDEKKRFLD